MQAAYTFKKDIYRKSRGNYSRLIDIYCRKCRNLVAIYQKDGPGDLRRLYLDRIYHPKNLMHIEEKNIKSLKNLTCTKCKEILGTPGIYAKENRKIFRLYQDAVIKSIRRQR